MTEAAKEARKLYYRKWRKDHPGKDKEYHKRYWERKAQAEALDKPKQGAESEQAS